MIFFVVAVWVLTEAALDIDRYWYKVWWFQRLTYLVRALFLFWVVLDRFLP